ncbi:MAG: PEP-CTERM sorting domain-containing protein [Kiritimatiellales bacterium]|nr:PEP-CTERM sorting domain-containing protein [Kiritimatiellota bacterium]MBL7011342.1 PEP-CTERM sorting domain-containing protein [Kiritimatiellales bacterium]
MKKLFIGVVVLMGGMAYADLLYDFTDKGGTFDGQTSVVIPLTDGAISFNMTVSGSGGNLNSNLGNFGIGDDQIDGTSESITLTFSKPIDFKAIEFGSMVGGISDGANLTVAGSAIDLYTGVSGFDGTPDIYTPASPIRVNVGQSIVITGSSETSSFDLENMTFEAVPEPATMSLVGIGGLLALIVRRTKKQN